MRNAAFVAATKRGDKLIYRPMVVAGGFTMVPLCEPDLSFDEAQTVVNNYNAGPPSDMEARWDYGEGVWEIIL